MPLNNVASAPVRPATENRYLDFDRALGLALAPLDRLMPQRQRAEALARARREILAAVSATMATERRRVVQMTTTSQLRREVLELIESREQLLDYIDDLERQPVIAAEMRRLRCRAAVRSDGCDCAISGARPAGDIGPPLTTIADRDAIMAENENNTLEPDEPENVGLVYLHRIAARLDSIEGTLVEAVVRLAAVERDVAAMRDKLEKLDRRIARVDMQRELAKLAAELEA